MQGVFTCVLLLEWTYMYSNTWSTLTPVANFWCLAHSPLLTDCLGAWVAARKGPQQHSGAVSGGRKVSSEKSDPWQGTCCCQLV
eukprot:1161921-Pelagomonas_calceolata.AAC.18